MIPFAPNSTQAQNTAAPLLAFAAGVLAGKGVFGWDTETWFIVLGAVGGAVATVWAAITTRTGGLVQQAVASAPAATAAAAATAEPRIAAAAAASAEPQAAIEAVAELPQVKGITINRNAPDAAAIVEATPVNVTAG